MIYDCDNQNSLKKLALISLNPLKYSKLLQENSVLPNLVLNNFKGKGEILEPPK